MLTILGVLCVLVGPSLGTIAAAGSNAALEVGGVLILLAGYVMIAIGLVMIVLAARRARGHEGPNKT
jgi:sulfite exporter TauE/SafE